MNFFAKLLERLRGEPSVSALVADMQQQQKRLSDAAAKLKELAALRRAEAEALAKRVKAHSDDADWAERVAKKFGDLIK